MPNNQLLFLKDTLRKRKKRKHKKKKTSNLTRKKSEYLRTKMLLAAKNIKTLIQFNCEPPFSSSEGQKLVKIVYCSAF